MGFSVRSAIQFGWETFKKRPWFFIGATAILAAVLALMFMFTTFLVIERELGPIEALKESNRITRGHKWNLLGLLLMLILVNLLGVLALIVGLLVSVPVTMLALTHVYRVLGGAAEARPADAALAA
jgi:uncharacterized membrane protein